MTLTEYASWLKKPLCGGFLFHGEERYLIRRYLEQTRSAFFDDADLATFNHIRLDDERFSPEALKEAMESLPVFADRKLIEISGVELDRPSADDRESLLAVLALREQYEYNTVILVATPEELNPGTAKKPSPLFRSLCELLTPVPFERQTGARLNKWLGQHFAAVGVYADPAVCTFLINYCGNDMYALSAQAEKCACYLLSCGREKLTEQDIRSVASPHAEYDAFALSDALLQGDTDRALAILADRLSRKEKPELILGGISSTFIRLLRVKVLQSDGLTAGQIAAKLGIHSYQAELSLRALRSRDEETVRRILTLCSETDQKLKASSIDPTCLLQRLVAQCGLTSS